MTETKYTLRGLLAAEKGNVEYKVGDAFLLHVCWEAPSLDAAKRLLAGLQQCANATHRDTPCVPTYFFRISRNDTELCSPPPKFVRDHPHLLAALKKLQVGIPPPVVRNELVKRGYDPALVELSLDAELPHALQTQPVAVEFTEVYLDERAFMEHAGSRDYLNGYGVVMDPALHYHVPQTLRTGDPPATIVTNILEPILKEKVAQLPEKAFVWQYSFQRPTEEASKADVDPREQNLQSNAFLMSMDISMNSDVPPEEEGQSIVCNLPDTFREACSTCVAFAHPMRVDRGGGWRLLCVIPGDYLSSPLENILWRDCFLEFATLYSVRSVEVHTNSTVDTPFVERLETLMISAGLPAETITINATECVGYVLHTKAAQLKPLTVDALTKREAMSGAIAADV